MIKTIISTPVEITATGVKTLTSFELTGYSQFVEMKSSGLTGKAKLQQTIDRESYHDIEDSEKDIATTMGWNLCHFPDGITIRVS